MAADGISRFIDWRGRLAIEGVSRVEITIERRLSRGTIRVTVQSTDIPSHSALTSLKNSAALNLALVNVLDVAQGEIVKAREAAQRDSDR